jgi:hypothetical protein
VLGANVGGSTDLVDRKNAPPIHGVTETALCEASPSSPVYVTPSRPGRRLDTNLRRFLRTTLADGHVLVCGVLVVTSDGDNLGVVGEKLGDVFQVEVNQTPGYWIPLACVTSTNRVAVLLECSLSEARAHRVPAAWDVGEIRHHWSGAPHLGSGGASAQRAS